MTDPLSALLRDLDTIRAHIAAREAASGPSPLGGILEAARAGVTGTGCSGTRGALQAREHTPPRVSPPPPALARYRALCGLPGHRVRAWLLATLRRGSEAPTIIVTDTKPKGGAYKRPLTVAEMAAFALHPSAPVWHAKIARKDSAPALRAAAEAGRHLLALAAREWAEDVPAPEATPEPEPTWDELVLDALAPVLRRLDPAPNPCLNNATG